MPTFGPPASVREGASELGAKLKSDVSRFTRARRAVSLKPRVACPECDGAGRLPCASCEGTGRTKMVLNEQIESCPTCEGKGTLGCIDCSGRGWVPNAHRKKVLWLLVIGGLAWGFVLYRIWGGDVAPETVAKARGGGGQSLGRQARQGNSRGAGAAGTVPGSGLNPAAQQPATR